jgi:NitT/TauT family transport system substrate-binding protein
MRKLRRAMALMLAVAILIGCHSAPRAADENAGLTRVKLQTDWYPPPEHGGFYTALVKGFCLKKSDRPARRGTTGA